MSRYPLMPTLAGRVVQNFYMDHTQGAKLLIVSNYPELGQAQILVDGQNWVMSSVSGSKNLPISDANYADLAQYIIDAVAMYSSGTISYFGSSGTSGLPPKHMSTKFSFGAAGCGVNLLILIGSVFFITLLLMYVNSQLSNRF